jgi:hypothetical protein
MKIMTTTSISVRKTKPPSNRNTVWRIESLKNGLIVFLFLFFTF